MPTATGPNVLMVICDDLGYGDLACYGNPHVRTPRLDALARQGTRLTRYCSGPLCTPARAELMTGRCAYRTRAIDTYLGRSMIDPGERTLAHVLGAAEHDYRTGLFGKWHLGDCHPMRPMDMGFEEALYHTGGGLEQPANIGRRSYFSPDLVHNGQRVGSTGYCTDVFTDAAQAFIHRHAHRPFFCYVAFNAPHDPLQIGEEWVQPYRRAGVPEETARLYGMVENIDFNVGRLLDTLDQLRLADNTIVIFLSDHGLTGRPRFNDGLRGQKCSMFEGGLRVPALIRWPGRIPANKTWDGLTGPIDWLPTLASICAAQSPSDRKIDGLNLWPHLTGASSTQPRRSLILQWHRGDRPEPHRNAAVITQQHKLVWPQRQAALLFDLLADQGEQHDLGGVEHPIGRELAAAYDAWFADVSNEHGPNTFDPPRIVLGTRREPQTFLTWQDWRLYQPREDEWWKPEMPGYWLVHVHQSGRYRLAAELPEIPQPTRLHVRCGSVRHMMPVFPRDRAVGLGSIELPAGDQRLEVFLGDDQPALGPMHVSVEGPVACPVTPASQPGGSA